MDEWLRGGLRVRFAIRSHRRPVEALATFKTIRSLTVDEPVLVYVEQEQVKEYQEVFGVALSRFVKSGALGSGENVWAMVEDALSDVPPEEPPMGLMVLDDNIKSIRRAPCVDNDFVMGSCICWCMFLF